jgi:signal transduction histidine kinase
LRESLPWLLALLAIDALFILFVWLVDTKAFFVLIGLMLLVSLAVAAAPIVYRFMRYRSVLPVFEAFSREPDEAHEATLTDMLPSFQRHLVHTLGEQLRAARTELNAANIAIVDYESWIESWVHGVKTPLALMRLLLDNRTDEMSPLVAQRLNRVHTTIARDVENILFYARLEAQHKDYLFESLDLYEVCLAAVQASHASLEEAGVSVELESSLSEAPPVTSDRNGLLFILGQLLSNSVKHAQSVWISAETIHAEQPVESERPSGNDGRKTAKAVVLTLNDNGPGVSAADLPFIFDKGFTGTSARQRTSGDPRQPSATGTNTGMGLYLAQRMAYDLAIEMTATSKQNNGLAITLRFPAAKTAAPTHASGYSFIV